MCVITQPFTEINFHQTTTLTPEQFVAGLTDFGQGRSKLFANSADEYLKVHSRSHFQADVTEGSRGIWERLHYDWSNPQYVILTTTDSNLWGGASGYTYSLTRRSDGVTEIDLVIVREGKNFKGRFLGFILSTIGVRVLRKAFENSVKAIEARMGATGKVHRCGHGTSPNFTGPTGSAANKVLQQANCVD